MIDGDRQTVHHRTLFILKHNLFYHFLTVAKPPSPLCFFSGATGGVMLRTNMALPVLLVQPAMLEAAGTISATKVGLGGCGHVLSPPYVTL